MHTLNRADTELVPILVKVQLLQTLPPHPCIIRFEGAFIDSNELYIVFEWAEHGDLRRLLKRAHESNTSLQELKLTHQHIACSQASPSLALTLTLTLTLTLALPLTLTLTLTQP